MSSSNNINYVDDLTEQESLCIPPPPDGVLCTNPPSSPIIGEQGINNDSIEEQHEMLPSPRLSLSVNKEQRSIENQEELHSTSHYNSNTSLLMMLRNVAIHVLIGAAICTPVQISIHKYGWYELSTRTEYANSTFNEMKPHDQIRYSMFSILWLSFVFTVFTHHILISMLQLYHPRYTKVHATVFVILAFLMTAGVTLEGKFCCPSFYSLITPVVAAGEIVAAITIVCIAAWNYHEHDVDISKKRNAVKGIALCGLSTILGTAYIRIIIVVNSFRTSTAFRWTTPFVIPATAFMVRFVGTRSELRETTVAKLSVTISASSSIFSRISQCAYLSDTLHDTDFTMFLVMELFYGIVGLIIRVSLHHRQLVFERLFAGELKLKELLTWSEIQTMLKTHHNSRRGRVMSSMCIVHSEIFELTSFIVLFATRVSLMPATSELGSEYVGKLVCLFVGCLLFQMMCCHVTNVLVRKVDAIPIEELDMPIRPWRKLWSTQMFHTTLMLTLFTNSINFMYESWFNIRVLKQ